MKLPSNNSKNNLTTKGLKNNLTRNKNKPKLALYLVLLIIIAVFIFYLFFNFKREKSDVVKVSIPIIKLALLNGCGYPGIAKEVKNILVDKNFDVIAWRNVERDMFIYEKSIIVIKKYDKDKLSYFQKMTGLDRRIFALDENTIEDFQIILGKDFKRYFKK